MERPKPPTNAPAIPKIITQGEPDRERGLMTELETSRIDFRAGRSAGLVVLSGMRGFIPLAPRGYLVVLRRLKAGTN